MCGAVLDDVARRSIGLLADDDRSDRGRRLETCRCVDDIAGHHRLAVIRPRRQLDDRLSRVDCDADLQPVLLGPVADGQRCTHRSLRIVPVRRGRAEHAHHGVSDELLHSPAEALQPRPHLLVVGGQEGSDVLGVERLRVRREADEVHEQHRDDAPLLANLARLERSGAGVAESGVVGVLLAAA